jgi:hypothetical protein
MYGRKIRTFYIIAGAGVFNNEFCSPALEERLYRFQPQNLMNSVKESGVHRNSVIQNSTGT